MADETSENNIDNEKQWEAPPPEDIVTGESAQMSEVSTLASIFFEPGKTFEDLRRKPRFIMAGLIVILAVSVFQILLTEKVGLEKLVKARLEASSRTRDLPKEQQDEMIAQQSSLVVKYLTYGAVPFFMIIIFLIGGLYYWGGAIAFGGSSRFLHGLSIWIYSSFPPVLLSIIGNIIILSVKSVDDIDLAQAQEGLIQANLGMFADGKEMPVLAALLSSIDLFQIFGYVLAAIGLKTVAKISTGSAWAIVLILALVILTFRVIFAAIF